MSEMDVGNDDQTFRVNFSSDGAAKLREKVKEKLKEYMGDYTDDTLVEYVIVLLRNGRSREEARNELNVFLGDDIDSFVSWLWDHLALNIELYAQPWESYPEGGAKAKPTLVEQAGRNENHVDPESDRGKSSRLSRSRHNREWKGLVRDATETPPLRSSEIDNLHIEEKLHRKHAKQSLSPEPSVQKKRNRPDDWQQTKRDAVSQGTVGAPRRLLQFAVRDAVATARPSNLAAAVEPTLKRLRSVVSTATSDSSIVDRPLRLKSVARVPNAVATAVKAVAEAAEDVKKVRSSVNVFDRLSRGVDESETIDDQHAEIREATVEGGEYSDFNQIPDTYSSYLQRSDYSGHYIGKMAMMESETGLASDSASDNDGYDDVNIMGHRVMGVSQAGTSGGSKGEDSLMVQYSVAKNSDDVVRKTWTKDQEQPAAVANASRKIVNISVNVNTWKPPHYQASREVTEVDSRKPMQENVVAASKSDASLKKENSNIITAGNGNAKPVADSLKEPQKTHSATVPYSTGRPSEDADSRTIFVSNVHFAATKDSLSRHFNKFGEVLKVVIITDAATGQPKGAAYVEFMRKEAAEHALSLDGTSFMSRILKVVRKSAAQQEAAPMLSWARAVRGSPFAVGRFARAPFSRGIPSTFRARLPIKPGARSLQWKRDEGGATATAGNSFPSPTTRSLTYIRTEPKP
ncbi:nucleolin 1 [Malania oleifera]|uniref:nucleolin 1 n=1 Tax=Malania oleifera TaxID=397392 RepID=UPI0025AE9666|nr:nucleolin 1 [Malania oleifera]